MTTRKDNVPAAHRHSFRIAMAAFLAVLPAVAAILLGPLTFAPGVSA